MKRRLITALAGAGMFLIAATVSADSLTDYRLGHFNIFAGYWGNYSSVEVTNPAGYTIANTGGGFDGAVAVGLGHCFALRYDYSYLPNSYTIQNVGVNTAVQSHEVDFVFKAGNDVSTALGNLKALFSKDPFIWYTEPDGRNSLGLYVGGRFCGGSSNHPELVAIPADYVSSLIFGTYSSTQVSKRFSTFGQVAVTTDLSLLGTAGVSFAVEDGVDISVSYKYESFVSQQQSFYTKSGFIYGLNFQY